MSARNWRDSIHTDTCSRVSFGPASSPRVGPRYPSPAAASPGLWLLILLLIWFAGSVIAQEEDGFGPEGFFLDKVDVNLINVDVFVTDKNGRRINGLRPEDFEIFQDGKPMEITNFAAIEGNRVAFQTGPEVAPLPDEDPPDPRLAPILPEHQRLHLVVYVDNVNIHPLNRQKSFSSIRSFLRQRLSRDDKVMVVSYDKSLNERLPFTSDRERIATTLFELEEVAGHRVPYNSERTQMLDAIYDANSLVEVSAQARHYAESLFNDLTFSISALRSIVDSLAGLPGRKAILYVSDGLGMRAGEDIFYALDDKFGNSRNGTASVDVLQIQNYDVSRRLKALTTEAASNRIVFYSLDAAGLRTHANADVQNYRAGRGSSVHSIHVDNLQEPLHFIANETGGQAIVNTNNFGPMLERVGDDFSTFYSLAFQSPESGTGRLREIEVQLKDPKGKKLRYRKSYRDQPVERRMADTAFAALHYGYERNDLGVQLEIGNIVRGGGDTYMVPLVIKIPMRRLSFFPHESVQSARLRLFITAKDEDGGLAPVQVVPVPIEIEQEDFARAQQSFYHLNHTLEMTRGRQIIAVGVRDEIGATDAFVLGGVELDS